MRVRRFGITEILYHWAQALPYLFPSLQRSMLTVHYANCLEDDGYMTFRMPLV